MSCPTGGIVITRHNEIRDKIIHIKKQDFYPNCIRVKPLIHLVRSRYEEEASHREIFPETRGDGSIRGLWEIQTEAIIDVRFVDSDTETWKPVRMDNLWIICWKVGIKPRNTNMGRLAITNGENFPHLPSRWMG